MVTNKSNERIFDSCIMETSNTQILRNHEYMNTWHTIYGRKTNNIQHSQVSETEVKRFSFFIDFTHPTHMQIYLLAWYTFQIASCRTLPFKSVPNKDWMDAFSSNGSTPLSRYSLPPAMVTMEMAKQSRKSKSRETKVRDWRSHSHSQRRGYGSWQDRFQRN